MRSARLVLSLVLTAAGLGARPVGAEDAKPTPAPAKKPLEPKDRAILLPLFHGYLDPDSTDSFKFRIHLQAELKRLHDAGTDVLADTDGLLSIVYATRSFHPLFEKRLLPREAKEAEISVDPSTGCTNVSWDPIRLSLSLPPPYMDAAKGKKLNAMPPFPMIVTMHELEDFQDAKSTKKFPGQEVIKRRWDRKTMKAVTDSWIVFAPVATRAEFVKDGRPRLDRLSVPMSEVWRRYHVDFDRFVLDGGSDALLFAASQPNFYAGLIVRSEGKADLPSPDLARNFAHLPVYVVGSADCPIAKTLKAGGFPDGNLTVGGVEGLPEWLSKVHRVVPKSFRWAVKDPESQPLANWINIESFDPASKAPGLTVQAVDTAEEPNTVKILSQGVRGITVFLSDRLVDLDREVRLVVNGQPVKEARIASSSPNGLLVKLPMKFDRTLDGMFDHNQLSIRQSMYYGWLFPVALQQIPVSADAASLDPAAPATPASPGGGETDPAARERAEREAQQYFSKGEEKEKAGDLTAALSLYRKAAGAGETSLKTKAEAKVKALEAQVGAPEKPPGGDKPNGTSAK